MEEKSFIYDFYKNEYHIKNEETLHYLTSVSYVRNIDKEETFIWYGDEEKYFYILVSGIILAYHDSVSSQEIIDCIVTRKGSIFAMNPYLEECQAKYLAYTLQKTQVIVISKADFKKMVKADEDVNELYIQHLAGICQYHFELRNMLNLSGVDKVKWYFAHYQAYEHLIPKKVVAYYLHVTPSTYSKLLKKIEKES